MNTLLIGMGAWTVLTLVIVVIWHKVMQHAHRQDLRRPSALGLSRLSSAPVIPVPRPGALRDATHRTTVGTINRTQV